MRFIITARPADDRTPQTPDAPFDEALFTAYMKFNEEMHKAGVLVAAEGLNPAGRGAPLTSEEDVPPALVELVRKAAPTWSATWKR